LIVSNSSRVLVSIKQIRLHIYTLMSALINILLFFIVLCIYVHIVHQLKKSEDLEIYELDYISNSHLQEVCDIKQPVLFEYQSVVPSFFEKITFDHILEVGGSQDVKIKEAQEYWKSDESVDYAILPFRTGKTLMSSDKDASYFSEKNESFVEESGFDSVFRENDEFLKPYMTLQTKYDILFGSANVELPLRYHTEYRKFICVMTGKIRVKMTPWKSRKYLFPILDYDNYEFKSPVNVWKPQRKYLHEMDKIRFLEFDIHPGYAFYIPPYWWYSIKYSDCTDNLLCGITYNSIMNCAVNLPHWGLYFLQQQNIHKKLVKTMEIATSSIDVSMQHLDAEDEPVEKTVSGIKIIETENLHDSDST